MERETGIEPASLAWKARVLPLNYSRASLSTNHSSAQRNLKSGGGDWIRTSVGVSQQIYSLPPLATRAPLQRVSDCSTIILTERQASKNFSLQRAAAAVSVLRTLFRCQGQRASQDYLSAKRRANGLRTHPSQHGHMPGRTVPRYIVKPSPFVAQRERPGLILPPYPCPAHSLSSGRQPLRPTAA